MARSFTRFVGMNDPQLVGHALMMGALVWLLRREAQGKSAVPPILAMAAAGFYKHNIVAGPITSILWLALSRLAARHAAARGRRRRGGARLADLHRALWRRLPRQSPDRAALSLASRPQGPWPAAMDSAGAGAVRHLDRGGAVPRAARFTLLFIGVAFAAYLAQWGGEAILDNAQFDLVIATAVGLGLAFDRAGKTAFGLRHGATAARAVVVLVVAARLLATLRVEPALVLFDPGYRAQYFENTEAVRAEAARIAQIPGPVACDYKVVCRLAGKPFAYDDFRAEMLVMTGASHGLDVEGLIRAHGLTRVHNDPRGGIEALFRTIAGKP